MIKFFDEKGRHSMYRKTVRGWLKHLDFILIDEICLLFSSLAAFQLITFLHLRFDDSNPNGVLFLILFINLAVIIAFDTMDNILVRDALAEFRKTVIQAFLVLSFVLLSFVIRNEQLDRAPVTYAVAMLLYIFSTFLLRQGRKAVLHKKREDNEERKAILIVTEEKSASEILQRMKTYSFSRYSVAGLVLTDRDAKGEAVDGIPVVANLSDAASYICRSWIDEVFFCHASLSDRTQNLIEKCREMALTIHLYVALQGVDKNMQSIEHIAGYEVLTANLNLVEPSKAFMKRAIDIFVGLMGSIAAGIIILFLGPVICLQSPGPILFKQERIGENGKKFTMYKIRSMYLDAEKRKAELAASNSHGDGMMFKMDFDPRVIGNRILPDGTMKKGIGYFIRKTSIDEFPQFFNVLKGDMSIVGTRPPTVDEWEKYELHHRARMSVKPGLTGLWQICPEKDEMPFEEIVELDTNYITHWSLGNDIRIIFRTFRIVVNSICYGNGKLKDKFYTRFTML